MDTISITQQQLEAVLHRWEGDARDGKTRSREETEALPVDQVARENAQYLWGELRASSSATEANPAAA